jgi:protein gp37
MEQWLTSKHHRQRPRRTARCRRAAACCSCLLQWLDQPVHRARPRVHFVCAHSDLFHPAVPDEWRDKCYAVMAAAHWHIFIVLTKRPEIAAEYWRDQDARAHAIFAHREATPAMTRVGWSWAAEDMPWPLPNIWHGTSIEDQRHADERLPPLFEIPSALYWASVEPMLGPVSLREWLYPIGEAGVIDRHALGWVVAGGDSIGADRFLDPAWVRVLRDQCVAADVPFFLKQWGRYYPAELIRTGSDGEVWRRWYDGTEKWSIEEYSMALADGAVPVQYADVGKKNAGRRLDGETWSQMPKQLGWALQEAA